MRYFKESNSFTFNDNILSGGDLTHIHVRKKNQTTERGKIRKRNSFLRPAN